MISNNETKNEQRKEKEKKACLPIKPDDESSIKFPFFF